MAMKPVKPKKTSQPKPQGMVQQFVTKRDKVAQNAIDSAFGAVNKIREGKPSLFLNKRVAFFSKRAYKKI